MRSSIAAGSVVAGFRVDSLIGEGAMGAVYLAEDTRRGEKVALKVLAPELARDDRFRQRFLRESQLAGALDHPHIVPTIASGEEDGVLYLAMAYVEGSDLRELLRRDRRLEPERALDLIGQVADALDAAHGAGLVHRDVKPGNILVSAGPDGEHAYVCDFGLARHVSSVSSLTGERGFVGTIDYVPPEQIEGGAIDGRADVYSLGCVLFECLAGERPFERESELSVVFAHLNEPPPRLSDLRPELPQAFDDVFATALAKSPADRYSTCGDLVTAARAALRGKVILRRKRRRRRLLVAAGVLLAAAGAVIGGVFVSLGGHVSAHPRTALRTISLRPDALSLIDAKALRVAGHVGFGKEVGLGATVSDVAFAGGSAWVLRSGEQRIVRVDPSTHEIKGLVKLPWAPGKRIATGAGSLWVTREDGQDVVRVDARTGKVADRFAAGGGDDIAYGDGSLWLARGPSVDRVDARSGRLLRRVTGVTGGAATPANYIAFADGAVWLARAGNGLVTKIDPMENRIVAQTRLHGQVRDLAVGGGLVWVSVVPDGVVFELSEDDLAVRGSLASGPDPERLSFGGGRLWIANTAAKAISLLDPASGRRSEISVGATPSTLVYRNGSVWVAAAPAPAALPPVAGTELRISMVGAAVWSSDPLHAGYAGDEQRLYATCANLLNYPDSARPEGTRLQPEIAAAMPAVSRDRRTYTFRIRPGFRFSPPSNEAVTAETFRHTIERALSHKLGAYGFLVPFSSDIVGASA
jgi:tRNA A-37 threonylcarbamoyl transferase component Bud32/streptogramin lyase